MDGVKVQYSRLSNNPPTNAHGRKHPNGMDGTDHHWRIPSIIWIPLMTCVVLLFVLDVFQIQTYSVPSPRSTPQQQHVEEPVQDDPRLLRGFLIKNEGCRIPHMDPFDRSVLHCISKMEPPVCNDGKPPLYDANRTSLYLLHDSLASYGVDHFSNLSCCYTAFWRNPPVKDDDRDDNVYYVKRCRHLAESARIKEEFIRVTCEAGNETVYQDYFAFVPLKDYSYPKEVVLGWNVKGDVPLNVLVVGLDAVSRVNLHRQMPKTVAYLRNISAVELLGYNKVGDNTFPNLIPVLTGMNVDELKHDCWSDGHRFDKCSFLWDTYKKLGFVTAFGEDSAWMGIFNYAKKGFHDQPTDYMWGAFNRESEKVIGNQHKMNVNQCVGSRPVYRTLLDYVDKFAETMRAARRRYFAFFWGASLSHDYLNMPSIGDEVYMQFFRELWQSGKLADTMLVFMSDHGIRWGEIRQTYQGRMEERLPFVYVLLPAWFKEKYPLAYRNLKRNVRKLTTPFDLHETLAHLSNFSEPAGDGVVGEKRRGYSLFTDISPKRTCRSANISSHWCACQRSFEIERNSSVVLQAAAAIVDHMNGELKGYAQCAGLMLRSVLDARMMSHGKNILTGNVGFRDYMLTVRTEPGEGVFESTVRHHVGKNSTSFEITGTVSRLNLYGNQSLCITDFHLKLYCYCTGLLEALSF